MKQIINYITLSVLTLSLLSCTKSFDEVNTDPDNPTPEMVKSTNMLAFCERYASDNLFDEWFDLNETSGFSFIPSITPFTPISTIPYGMFMFL